MITALVTLLSFIIYCIGYYVSFFFFSYHTSHGIISSKKRVRTNPDTLLKIWFAALFAMPILTSLIFGFGYGIKGRAINWGSELYDLYIIEKYATNFSCMILIVPMTIALIIPKMFKFRKRMNVLIFYTLHHLYIYFAVLLIKFLVPIFCFKIHSLAVPYIP